MFSCTFREKNLEQRFCADLIDSINDFRRVLPTLTAQKMHMAERKWPLVKNTIKSFHQLLHSSNEFTNFTYNLTPLNIAYLASFLSNTLNVEYEYAHRMIQECLQDKELNASFEKVVNESS